MYREKEKKESLRGFSNWGLEWGYYVLSFLVEYLLTYGRVSLKTWKNQNWFKVLGGGIRWDLRDNLIQHPHFRDEKTNAPENVFCFFF